MSKCCEQFTPVKERQQAKKKKGKKREKSSSTVYIGGQI